MTTNDYNALIKATAALREADTAFSQSYNNEIPTPEQHELFRALTEKLDDMYVVSNMLIDNETYRRDKRRRCLGSG